LPQHAGIFLGEVRAEQIMPLPAKGLSEFVFSQPEGESLRVDWLLWLRHTNLHQAIVKVGLTSTRDFELQGEIFVELRPPRMEAPGRRRREAPE
jgi:hypothetical protein